jgi:hypothetical protein
MFYNLTSKKFTSIRPRLKDTAFLEVKKCPETGKETIRLFEKGEEPLCLNNEEKDEELAIKLFKEADVKFKKHLDINLDLI